MTNKNSKLNKILGPLIFLFILLVTINLNLFPNITLPEITIKTIYWGVVVIWLGVLTFVSIKNTRVSKERVFLIKINMIIWIILIFLVICSFYLSRLYEVFWLPIIIMIAMLALYQNKKQKEIRETEKKS
ncbi:MAG: hypothetical protein KJ887_04230 [Candidatus Omnitrophica bacterium]|nr:hypothetical protein [Candidatus Omnitrophota bacterium]MBU1047526.1 hypothetical protein [Candidatus Omnitrophota bacterium]MBU1888889.1 hypothetical protein [Candidatus Omnitrophota bacterium]